MKRNKLLTIYPILGVYEDLYRIYTSYTQLQNTSQYMDKKTQLVEMLTEMLSRYGGKRAVKFILTSLGAMPFVEDIIEASRDKLSDIEKQNLSDKLQEWIEFDNVDLSEALRILDAELNQPKQTCHSYCGNL